MKEQFNQEYFQIQFSGKLEKTTLETGDSHVYVTRIFPETPCPDSLPTIYFPGFAGASNCADNLAQDLLVSGREVVTLDFLRVNNSQNIHLEAEKARLYAVTANKLGLNEVDIVAHSEGAIPASIFAANTAKEQSCRVRNMVLTDPVGFVNTDVATFLTRMVKDNLQTARRINNGWDEHSPTGSVVKQVAKASSAHTRSYILKNLRKAHAEVWAITHSSVLQLLQQAKNEQQTQICIISGVEDVYFQMAEIQNSIERNPNFHIDAFLSVIGGHNETHFDRRHRLLVVEILNKLGNRRR